MLFGVEDLAGREAHDRDEYAPGNGVQALTPLERLQVALERSDAERRASKLVTTARSPLQTPSSGSGKQAKPWGVVRRFDRLDAPRVRPQSCSLSVGRASASA